MQELHYAVLYLGKQRIKAVVKDSANKVMRTIRYDWKDRDHTDTPPVNWAKSVYDELEYQRGEDQHQSLTSVFRGAK